jgi:hypothetical protein
MKYSFAVNAASACPPPPQKKDEPINGNDKNKEINHIYNNNQAFYRLEMKPHEQKKGTKQV